jgi:hypothetical protein
MSAKEPPAHAAPEPEPPTARPTVVESRGPANAALELNPAYAWRTTRDGPLTLHAIGNCLHLPALAGVFTAQGAEDIDAAARLLRQ